RNEKLANRPRTSTVEVDRFSPFVLVAIGEICRRKLLEVVAVRTEVVVDNIEYDAEAQCMCAIDESAEVVGCAVEMSRRKQIDTVISPAKAAVEISYRHDLEHGNPGLSQLREEFSRSVP